MKLLYIANARIPTEKAHGLQIMQNCEAFAAAGVDVTLWAARRFNTRSMRAASADPWGYYGVQRNFVLGRLPCLDPMPLIPGGARLLLKLGFYLQFATFLLALLARVLFHKADVYYSRDPLTLLILSLMKPRRALVYEAHTLRVSHAGLWMQGLTARRVGTLVAITGKLAAELEQLGADPERTIVAHDGIRAARFADMPQQIDARREIRWPQDAFIVGFVGRLHMMAVDKGVGTLVEALRNVDGAYLALVGGPDEMAAALRQRWIESGMDADRLLYAGHVRPQDVPRYLSAFDVCAMPHPYTRQFANFTSPLKLFEYMASRRAIVASDLPGFAEVLVDGESALLVEAGDAEALGAALIRLRDDPALRTRLADAAYEQVMAQYTWDVRAQKILAKIREVGGSPEHNL